MWNSRSEYENFKADLRSQLYVNLKSSLDQSLISVKNIPLPSTALDQ